MSAFVLSASTWLRDKVAATPAPALPERRLLGCPESAPVTRPRLSPVISSVLPPLRPATVTDHLLRSRVCVHSGPNLLIKGFFK